MGKITTFLFALLVSLACHAQFNDTINYYLRFASTGVLNKTNGSSSYVLNNGLTFNTNKKKIAFNTSASWIYGEQQHNLTNNDFTAHGDVNFNKGIHKLYYWGLLNLDKSYSLKINYRLQAGAGVGYTIIDSPYVKITVSDGILYEQGDLIKEDMGHDIYQIPRNSFRLSYHLSIKDRVIIDGIHFFQPSLISINDYIIQSSSNISIKLKEWLSFTGTVVYNKVNRTNRENLLITYGLTYEKYF